MGTKTIRLMGNWRINTSIIGATRGSRASRFIYYNGNITYILQVRMWALILGFRTSTVVSSHYHRAQEALKFVELYSFGDGGEEIGYRRLCEINELD